MSSVFDNVKVLDSSLVGTNQLGLDLIQRSEKDEITSVVVITRRTDGVLECLWSDQETQEVLEAANYLMSCITEEVIDAHGEDEEWYEED